MVRRRERNIKSNNSASRKNPSTNKRKWKTRDDGAGTQRTGPSFMKRSRKASRGVSDVPRAVSPGRQSARRPSVGTSLKPSSKPTERSRSWRYKSSKDAGPFSYYASQKMTHAESPAIPSFFAPSKSDQSRNVELGLLIKKRWVGLLIGKKGGSIKQILKKSNGASIDFGDEDVVLGINPGSEKWEESPWPSFDIEKYTVCAISGTKAQAMEAAKLVAEFTGEAAQSPNYKLEFLIPQEYCGLFLGKKGVNVKHMQGTGREKVSLKLRDCSISLGDTQVCVCSIFGPAEKVLKAIERTSKWLGDISVKVQTDRDAARQNQRLPPELPPLGGYSPAPYQPPYADESRPVSGGPLPYRDGERDIAAGDYRNVPVRSRTISAMNPSNQKDDLFFY